jgi:hypothetical protein
MNLSWTNRIAVAALALIAVGALGIAAFMATTEADRILQYGALALGGLLVYIQPRKQV